MIPAEGGENEVYVSSIIAKNNVSVKLMGVNQEVMVIILQLFYDYAEGIIRHHLPTRYNPLNIQAAQQKRTTEPFMKALLVIPLIVLIKNPRSVPHCLFGLRSPI